MRPERRRLGDDDSSGVSSASSTCVSEPGAPSLPTPTVSPRYPEPVPEPAGGGFSVFGEQLDLFTEILQTQQRLQQCQQTTLDSCATESSLFCDVTSPSDVIRPPTPPSPTVIRTATPPSSDVIRAATPPSSDVIHTATPPSSGVIRATTPLSPDVTRSAAPPSPDVTRSAATPPSPDVTADAVDLPDPTGGAGGLSWVWGQGEGEEDVREPDWSRAAERDRRSDCGPGQGEGRDADRCWDSGQRRLQLRSERDQVQDRNRDQGRLPASGERRHAYVRSPVQVAPAEQSEGSQSPVERHELLETVLRPQESAESLSESAESQPESLSESAESQPESQAGRAESQAEAAELLRWVGERAAELRRLQLLPVSGNILTLQRQQEAAQSFLCLLERQDPSIREALEAAGVTSCPAFPARTDNSGVPVASATGGPATLQKKWQQLLSDAERHNDTLQSTLAKMHVLERCMQDVEQRLSELEHSTPDDVITTDDVTGDRLLAAQRGLDDVNDQVARLTENGAPLTADRSSRVAALTDRLRQLSSASPGGADCPDLSRSVEPPWERAETPEGVPYYLHHGERRTQWIHPRLAQLLTGLAQLDNVRFSAYRTALKLRRLQRTLLLHRLPLAQAEQTLRSQAWRLPCSGVAGVPDVLAVLTELYGRLQPPLAAGPAALALRVDLCLNWLLSVYDSRRTGSIPVYCLKLAITTMSQAHLEEKYRYLFQLSADSCGRLSSRRLSQLLRRLLQLPAQLSEAAAFGPDRAAASVTSCLAAAAARTEDAEDGEDTEDTEDSGGGLTERQVLDWLRVEPQSLVWLPVMHRVAGAEAARHQARCNTCKLYPIVGFRYRCLKCFNWDMCQQCFFTGRTGKHHKLSHPLHEYCTESSSSDGLRDLARSIRNRFKSKHHFRKHPKLAYLPVQAETEGEADAADYTSAEDSAEEEGEDVNHAEEADASNVFSSPDSEEELQLITQYCLGLSDSPPASSGERLRAVVRHLEQERTALRAEYRRLTGQAASSGEAPVQGALEGGVVMEDSRPGTPDWEDSAEDAAEEGDEDSQLRSRLQLLDDQNRQLGQQLSQLRRLTSGGGTSLARSSTLQTRAVTAAVLASDGPQPAASPGKLSRTKRLALSLARRNGAAPEITA